MCFDPSYLMMTTECDGNADAFDPNATVISLYYEYNETHIDECHPSSVNETVLTLDGSVNCSYKDIYRNITRGAALPVSALDAIEAGILALAMDEARRERKVVDLAPVWARYDALLHGETAEAKATG